jgi:Ca-activated chloride channel family protein
MSFEWPWVLPALLVVPLALWLYVVAQRRRQRYAARFTNLDLLANVVGRSPGWRRHVPPALYLLAVAALVVALARPQATIALPREQASVVLTSDSSGSMQATDVDPNRLEAAREAARTFVDRVPDRFRVGIVSFNHEVETLARPTTDRAAVEGAIASLRAEGGTATGEALARSLEILRPRARGGAGERERPRDPAAIVLLSDGKTTTGRDPVEVAREARRLGVAVHTVALGTPEGVIDVPDRFNGFSRQIPVPPDPETLRRVAEVSGGRHVTATEGGDLNEVYEDLSSRVGFVRERQEVTAGFAGAAALLLVAAGALSLLWFSRIP